MSRNILANAAGRMAALLSNIVFVPLYIRLMGGESYGLVVAYATLISALQVLDAGWSNLLSRQLALKVDHEGRAWGRSAANLARTIEVISWTTGAAVGAAVMLAAPWIADTWLITNTLPRHETVIALRFIGLTVAVQWPSMAYQGAIMGLQEQVRLNAIRIASSLVQAVGAALLLWAVSATVVAYFMWVFAIQLANTLWMRGLMWSRVRPEAGERPRFDWAEVSASWRFALGVAGIALLSSVLTQADKVVLSRTVPLAEFAVYGVAFTVCSVLNLMAGPVLQAILPRLTQLSGGADDEALRRLYFRGCELVALIVVPAWMVLCFHAADLMTLWLGQGARARAAAALLPWLASGSLLNALVTLPYGLQIASGWTSLSVVKNILTVGVFFPTLLWAVGRFGTLGAAAVWLGINAGYVLFEIPVMHRRLLKGSTVMWYSEAFLLPVTTGAVVGWLTRYAEPAAADSGLKMLLLLGLSFAAAAAALALLLPSIRHDMRERLGHRSPA